LFVFLKVLKLPKSSPLVYQQALLETELDAMLTAMSRRIGGVLAPLVVRDEYARLAGGNATTGGRDDAEEEEKKKKTTQDVEVSKRKPLSDDGDDCMICFDHMSETSEETLTFCRVCGHNFHMDCIRKWSAQQRSSRQKVKMPVKLEPRTL
jgi:hypothetical protein